MGDVNTFAGHIKRFAESPELVEEYARHTRNVPSVEEYAHRLSAIYKQVRHDVARRMVTVAT